MTDGLKRATVTFTCAACGEPVERTFDDEWQHVTVETGLACTAWPVRPACRCPVAKPRRTLTPADVTRRCPSFRSGRAEAWSAASRDGVWTYERAEISGTPWQVIHVPTGIEADWHGTLTAARAATADGSALAAVERIQAHDRGEHDRQRDVRCRRC